MKFLVNSMLGKLTRFLRIFGYNTVYANDLIKIYNIDPVPDDFLIEYANNENRIIITKDLALYRRYKDKSIFLKGEGLYNYLDQLNKQIGLKFEFNLKRARCSLCNSKLERVEDKISIKKDVLKETYNHFDIFYQCSSIQCKKVYWQGSHIEDIEYKLSKTFKYD
ncbi:MAG: Mut7-C RNAse domain-containing protein [Promethearchaeota archaeon]